MKKFISLLITALLVLSAFPVFATEEMPVITLAVDSQQAIEGIEAVIAAAEKDIGIKVEIELRPGGLEGDNLVKARLASGDMADILYYNSGSKLNELNPAENFINLTAYPAITDRLENSFASAVTVGEGVYGIPVTSSMAGAVLYNKTIYAELGLTVPTTWQQFLDNCAAIKEAGYYGLIGTFGESWTAQVLFLGDYYNVVAGAPNFAAEFQAGKAKYATTPSAVRSFEKYTEVIDFYNEDYLAATYEDGCDYLADGLGGHWIILSQALGNIYATYGKEVTDQIGVFGVPSDDGNSGLTVWVANAFYANKNTENLDAVMKFMEYCLSGPALDVYADALMPYGPFNVTGYQMGEDAFPAVSQDMQAYFDAGTTHVAQEFECAVKGANCESICIEVGSGAITAEEAAKIYDEDCLKMAVQLGFDWE